MNRRFAPLSIVALCLFLSAGAELSAQDFALRHSSGSGPQGGEVTMSLTLDNLVGANDVGGWCLSICYDPTVLLVSSDTDIELGTDAAAVETFLGNSHLTVLEPGNWVVGTIIDLEQQNFLPPGINLELERVTYQVVGSPGDSTDLIFCTSTTEPPKETILVVGVDSVQAGEVAGTFTVELEPLFRRGDVDDNGNLTIGDGLRLATFLFTLGEAPPCPDAADINDNAILSVGDIIALLSYLFVLGPEPAAPGPVNCGIDPTADTLGLCQSTVCP